MDAPCRNLTPPPPNQSTEYDAVQHRAIRQNYSAMVENIDRWLGIYQQELAASGQLHNTLIVYSSDHGEMLGDHNLWGKHHPHEPSVGVPLTIAGPGVAPGPPTGALISLIDLPATFLQYAGATSDTYGEGISLRPLLRRERNEHRQHLLSALEGWQTVRDQRWKLICNYPDNAPPILHDLRADPTERENLAQAHPEEVDRLMALLEG
jgi:arylsulfatase